MVATNVKRNNPTALTSVLTIPLFFSRLANASLNGVGVFGQELVLWVVGV